MAQSHLVARMTDKEKVYQALDNAVEGGYKDEITNNLLHYTVEDLLMCDSECENMDAGDVAQYMKEWIIERGLSTYDYP